MAKLSLPELTELAATYVSEQKIAVNDITSVREAVTNLVETIGAIFTLDTSFRDKLAFMDAEELSYGKTVEEWQMDLSLPQDYDFEGKDALKPNDPTTRPVDFSITLGEKTFATTVRRNQYNRAVHNAGQLEEIVTMILKRLYDSKGVWTYQCKRQALGVFIDLCEKEMADTNAVFTAATGYAVNTLLKDAATATAYGIVVKPYTARAATNWADAVSKGYIVPLDLVVKMAKPFDTETSDAFIKRVKKDVEIFNDESEGHSLNGNTLGAVEGLVLIVKQGIMPEIEVETQAGAFHLDKVMVPTEVIVVKDFGTANNKAYAILMDRRAVRKFNTSLIPDTDHNGRGHFDNYYLHIEDTIHISRNAGVRVYEEA